MRANCSIADRTVDLRLHKFIAIITIAVVPAGAAAQSTQDYPVRPIRLVVTSSAGGSSDTIARTVADHVGQRIGRNLVVDNRPGAAGRIGYELVARSSPDGYTLLHGTAGLVIEPAVRKQIPYSVGDFAPVTILGLGYGYLVVVNASSPIRSTKDLIAAGRSEGKPQAFGSSGHGNSLHIAGETFNMRAGTKLLHVPYKGVGPALSALMSGEIQLMFVPATVTVQHIANGKLRAIAFTGPRRWADMPGVPTVAETLPGFDVSGSWHAWFAPVKTSPAVVKKIYQATVDALKIPRIADFIIKSGYEPDGRSSADAAVFMADEVKRYADVVSQAKIEAQ